MDKLHFVPDFMFCFIDYLGYVTMTKRKPRLEKSRTPNKFSIHLSNSNLERIKGIREAFDHQTRNETINTVVDDYWHYLQYKQLIDALRKLVGKQSSNGKAGGVI